MDDLAADQGEHGPDFADGAVHERVVVQDHQVGGPSGLDPPAARQAMGAFAAKARDLGIEYIGSCCLSVAGHVKAIAQALGKLPLEEGGRIDYDRPMSAYEVLPPHGR